MRTDEPTHPFPPSDTDRLLRWPSVTDSPGQRASDGVTSGDLGSGNLASPRPTPVNLVKPPELRRPDRDEGPLPEVGDLWGLDHPDPPLAFATPGISAPGIPTPLRYPRRTAAPLVNPALVSGLLSIPLILFAGLGAILGLVAILLGVASLGQIRRQPGYDGTGRAVTAIITGAGSTLVGMPVLVILLILLA
ncbi:MAG: DUF4190 domain-containing protein [Gordonia sp. (in: high G+C Gram-positive bacteria)]